MEDSRRIEAAPDVFNEIQASGTVGTPTVGRSDGNLLINTGINTRKVLAQVQYHDQLLPFDIVIVAANEYGHSMKMVVHNVEVMNCGSGMSVDDITIDQSCTWVGTKITPWHAQAWVDPRTGRQIDMVSQTPYITNAGGRQVNLGS